MGQIGAFCSVSYFECHMHVLKSAFLGNKWCFVSAAFLGEMGAFGVSSRFGQNRVFGVSYILGVVGIF